MAEFEVILYEKENGDCPVEEFICSLDVKMRAKMVGLHEGKIILTNGFVKKTQKTPPEEIKLAKERRADFKERMGK